MPSEPISSRVGSFTLAVDGYWDIEDLLALAEAFSESYGYFYPLVVADEDVAKTIHEAIQKRFWSGDIETRRFGKTLYGMIPAADSLKLRSFSYASAGTMTLIGILSALWMAARVARSWAAMGSDILDLFTKIEDFFDRRRKRARGKREIELDDATAHDLDEARELAFSFGEKLGFDALSIERIIDITGNPITAVKYMAALAKEAKKLANLEDQRLLKLPSTPAGELQLGIPPKREMKGGIRVQKVRRRSPAKKR